MAGKRQGSPHKAAPERPETAQPVVHMDYCFVNSKEAESVPILVAKDQKTGMLGAFALEHKGVTEYGSKALAGFLEQLGHRRCVLMSDRENPIMKHKMAAAKLHETCEYIPRECAEGDKQANGAAEAAVKEIKKQMRTIMFALEETLRLNPGDRYPTLAWMPACCADVTNKL